MNIKQETKNSYNKKIATRDVFVAFKNLTTNMKDSILEKANILNEGGLDYLVLSYRSKALERKILFSYMFVGFAVCCSELSDNQNKKCAGETIEDIEFELNHLKIREENGYGSKKENEKRKSELLNKQRQLQEKESYNKIWKQIAASESVVSDKLENEKCLIDAKKGIIENSAKIKSIDEIISKLTSRIYQLQKSLEYNIASEAIERIKQKIGTLSAEKLLKLINKNDLCNEKSLYELELKHDLYKLNFEEENQKGKQVYEFYSRLSKINNELEQKHIQSLEFFKMLLTDESTKKSKDILQRKIFSEKNNIYLIQQEIIGCDSIKKLENIIPDLNSNIEELSENERRYFFECCKDYYSKSILLENLKLDNFNDEIAYIKQNLENEKDKSVIEKYNKEILKCEEQIKLILSNKNDLSVALENLKGIDSLTP